MENVNRPRFSMAAVRTMTGLTDRQIRYYEEMGLVKPLRTRGNQRIFTMLEIECLKEVKRLLAEGLTVEAVKETLAEARYRPALSYTPVEPRRALPGVARGLTSLYPASNGALLVEMILHRRKQQVKNIQR